MTVAERCRIVGRLIDSGDPEICSREADFICRNRERLFSSARYAEEAGLSTTATATNAEVDLDDADLADLTDLADVEAS